MWNISWKKVHFNFSCIMPNKRFLHAWLKNISNNFLVLLQQLLFCLFTVIITKDTRYTTAENVCLEQRNKKIHYNLALRTWLLLDILQIEENNSIKINHRLQISNLAQCCTLFPGILSYKLLFFKGECTSFHMLTLRGKVK